MTWVKTDDSMTMNPKVRAAGHESVSIYMAAIGYCNRNATDGHIPKCDVPMLWPGMHHHTMRALVTRLVEAGLLHELETSYIVHDYAEWQAFAMRQERDKRRERKKQNKQNQRLTNGVARRQDGDSNDRRPVTSRARIPEPEPEPVKSEEVSSYALTETASPSRTVFEFWKAETGRTASKFDAKRKRVIEARLREGYTVKNLCDAVRGCKRSKFHQGDNDQRKVYDDISLICRDASKVDSFLSLVDLHKPQKKQLTPRQDQAVWRLENNAMLHDDDADILREMGLL